MEDKIKIITENDFYQCSGGMLPSPFQSQQLTVMKKCTAKYIINTDLNTVSWVDFGCKKLMLLYAVAAAAVAAIAALCVATGGAALIAICALAGAAGAAWGAVVGSLICGQLVAPTRVWSDSKKNFIIQGKNAITSEHKMICNVFVFLGMSPEEITFAPGIKSWGQALLMGGASFLANVLGGALTGMMIGAGATAIPALISGGASAVASGGALYVIKFLGTNLVKNYLLSWFSIEGLAIRGAITTQTALDAYGKTGEVTEEDIDNGIFGLERGTKESAERVVTGHANPLDILGLVLWFSPLSGEIRESSKGKTETKGGERENESKVVETKASETKVKEPFKDGEAFEKGKTTPKSEDFIDAQNALKKAVDEVSSWSRTKQSEISTMVGAKNLKTGEVTVGMKLRNKNGGMCAEDIAVEQLGGNKEDIIFTEAYRPRTQENVPVCERCQTKYNKEQFPKGTIF